MELLVDRRKKRIPMDQRFWAKVQKSDDCWEWTGGKNSNGYGIIALPGGRSGNLPASRFSAMLHFGMFDSRLMVLHHCDNRGCVRPDHLYLGDAAQNAMDASSRNRFPQQQRTHCPSGHPYSADNTRHVNGTRYCRACQREATRKYREKNK